MLSARRIRQVPVRCRCPDGWARWASIPNSPVLSPSPRSKGRPPRSRRLRSPNFVSVEIRSLSSAASGGSALILNSCVAAGSLKLGIPAAPYLSCRPGLAWVGQPGPALRLGRITPHGVQARATRHVGRPVKPPVAQALVKPCAIAIAGLQIGGQALAV